jgi:O-antigen ligase
MTLMNKFENKDLFLFNFLLIIWILAIPFKNAIYQGSMISIILFFIYYLLKTKNIKPLIENFKQTKYLFLGFSMIILSMIISNTLNPDFINKKSWHITYMFIIRYGLMFVILAYFYKLDFFNKKNVVIAILSSFILLMLTGIYQIILDPNIIMGTGITGTLDNRNAFGLFMGMGFVLSVILLNYNKNLALFLILLFSFFMIFSFSRSSWVASSISAFILFSLNYKRIKVNHFIYLFLFLAFLLVLYFSFQSFQDRFHALLNRDSSSRTILWTLTLEFIKDKLFIGYGLDSFKALPKIASLNHLTDPHNSILEILLYTGIIGLFSCIFTIFIIIYKIIKTKKLVFLPIAFFFIIVTQFDFGAFFSKEILSFLTIFVFFVYSESFKSQLNKI